MNELVVEIVETMMMTMVRDCETVDGDSIVLMCCLFCWLTLCDIDRDLREIATIVDDKIFLHVVSIVFHVGDDSHGNESFS